ncbi:class E sortase [Lentzea sp. CA-135723]|uniref:class E sortase n=1 Tax=Lentzea sp. CA-135723 TaxID=3239950 RepID=UPI003D8A1C72
MTLLAAPPPETGTAPPPRPKAVQPLEIALITRVLGGLSLALLGFVAYVLVVGPMTHDRAQDLLYADAREKLAEIEMPTGGSIEPGSPVALLEIPGLHLNEVVVEGTTGGLLTDGPGHLRTTPLPGQPGSAVIMGRALTFGGSFRDITALREGDEVVATTGQGRFVYRVDGVRRDGDPMPKPGGNHLVLLSAEVSEFLGLPIKVERTVFVDTTLVHPSPSGLTPPPVSLLPEERALERDAGGLVPLVLWSQVLLLAVAGFTWARTRWGRWETWFVGAPVVLAASWQVYEYFAISLLPNLA